MNAVSMYRTYNVYQEDLDFNTRIYIIELPEGDLNYWKELSQHNPGLYVTARAYKTPSSRCHRHLGQMDRRK